MCRSGHRLLYFCFALFVIAGCDTGSRAYDKTTPQPKPEDTIVAGHGTTKIPIGMSEEKLLKMYTPSSSKKSGEATIYHFKKEGVLVGCRGGVVGGVVLYFRSDEYARFHGKTNLGIGAESTVRDVICTYGMPIAISNTIDRRDGKLPARRYVRLRYHRKGIVISFADGELTKIHTLAPVDIKELPAVSRSDIGDVTDIRKIDCSDWKPAKETRINDGENP